MSNVGPPPPPPPNLDPPPGYAGYQPNPSAAIPLKRVNGLRTALLVLLAAFAASSVINLVLTPSQVDSARDFLDGRIDEDTFTEEQLTNGFAQFLVAGTTLAIVVLTVIWLFRIAANHRALGRRVTWAPGWAIGGWLLPPQLYIIPLLMLREHWKASDPDVAPGDDRWRNNGESPLIWAWFLFYSLIPAALLIAGASVNFQSFSQDVEDLAETLVDGETLTIVSGIVGIVAAGAWALVVRDVTDRHTRLTGEAQRR